MFYSDKDGSESSLQGSAKENMVLSATNQQLMLQELRVEKLSNDTKKEATIEAIQNFSQHCNNKSNSQKPYEFREAKTKRTKWGRTRENRLEALQTIDKRIINTTFGENNAILPSMGSGIASNKDPGKSE